MAAVVGGLENLPGAVAGGFFWGLLNLGRRQNQPGYRDAIAFAVLIWPVAKTLIIQPTKEEKVQYYFSGTWHKIGGEIRMKSYEPKWCLITRTNGPFAVMALAVPFAVRNLCY